jgi:hypothetical protein
VGRCKFTAAGEVSGPRIEGGATSSCHHQGRIGEVKGHPEEMIGGTASSSHVVVLIAAECGLPMLLGSCKDAVDDWYGVSAARGRLKLWAKFWDHLIDAPRSRHQ